MQIKTAAEREQSNSAEWHFRSSLDRYVWIHGMLCAYLHPYGEAALQRIDKMEKMTRVAVRAGIAAGVSRLISSCDCRKHHVHHKSELTTVCSGHGGAGHLVQLRLHPAQGPVQRDPPLYQARPLSCWLQLCTRMCTIHAVIDCQVPRVSASRIILHVPSVYHLQICCPRPRHVQHPAAGSPSACG